jgi:hypothetical protein
MRARLGEWWFVGLLTPLVDRALDAGVAIETIGALAEGREQ